MYPSFINNIDQLRMKHQYFQQEVQCLKKNLQLHRVKERVVFLKNIKKNLS